MTNWRRPSTLPPALLAAIAVIGFVVLTLVLLLLINLFNGPGPAASGQPTTRPPSTTEGTAGIPGTAAPGATPGQPTNGPQPPSTDAPLTPPPTPDGSLTPGASLTPEQALVAHIPEPVRASCTVEPGTGQAELVARCTADDGALTVTYLQFGTAEEMAAAYANRLDQSQIEAGTGRCEDPETWPAESQYSVGGAITGRRLCTDEPGAPTIFWTDDRLNILGQVSTETIDFDRLIQFWTEESGPIP